MLKSVFIALPNKPNTLDCDQHRIISLMSHTLKLLLKIVLERCWSNIRPEIAQCQYGFMPDKGTRNAIFTLRMLSERNIQHQQNIYICFIDYKKAFDRVRHKRLFKMLNDVGLDEKDQSLSPPKRCHQASKRLDRVDWNQSWGTLRVRDESGLLQLVQRIHTPTARGIERRSHHQRCLYQQHRVRRWHSTHCWFRRRPSKDPGPRSGRFFWRRTGDQLQEDLLHGGLEGKAASNVQPYMQWNWERTG